MKNNIERYGNKLLNQHNRISKFKQIANKNNYELIIKKCQDKITEEYRFWIRKQNSVLKDNRIVDLEKDRLFINDILSKKTYSKEDIKRLKEIQKKYNA